MAREIRALQDVSLQGANGEPLVVGRRIRTGWLILPLVVSDGGYVLGVKGGKTYYPMPQGEALSRYQQAGHLPNPLPAYRAFPDALPVILAWLFVLLMVGVKLFGK